MKNYRFVFISIFCFMVLLSCKNHNVTINPSDLTYYTRRTVKLDQLGKEYILNLDQKIFSAVMDGKIKAYKEDSLTDRSLFTVAELKDRIDHKETITISPKPENPDYTIDTTVVTPFRLTEVIGHSVGEKWTINYESRDFSGSFHAFGLNWKPVIANVELHEQPVFWISAVDLQKIFTPTEIKTLNKLVYVEMTTRLSDY